MAAENCNALLANTGCVPEKSVPLGWLKQGWQAGAGYPAGQSRGPCQCGSPVSVCGSPGQRSRTCPRCPHLLHRCPLLPHYHHPHCCHLLRLHLPRSLRHRYHLLRCLHLHQSSSDSCYTHTHTHTKPQSRAPSLSLRPETTWGGKIITSQFKQILTGADLMITIQISLMPFWWLTWKSCSTG